MNSCKGQNSVDTQSETECSYTSDGSTQDMSLLHDHNFMYLELQIGSRSVTALLDSGVP